MYNTWTLEWPFKLMAAGGENKSKSNLNKTMLCYVLCNMHEKISLEQDFGSFSLL